MVEGAVTRTAQDAAHAHAHAGAAFVCNSDALNVVDLIDAGPFAADLIVADPSAVE